MRGTGGVEGSSHKARWTRQVLGVAALVPRKAVLRALLAERAAEVQLKR